jgi:uncharacterized protein (TIGR02679 family)
VKQTDSNGVDVEQVHRLLGGDDLRRLIERLRKRMSRGERLAGKIQLNDATALERSAVDRLLGRLPTRGDMLTIDLDKLTAILSHAKLCGRLEDAVTALVGPVVDERILTLARAELWNNLWQRARHRVEGNLSAATWVEDLQASGLLKRLAVDDPHSAETLLNNAISIVEEAPYSGVTLAELAASKTGNSHALDRGQPLGGLVIRYSRHVDNLARWKTAPQRRDAWETLSTASMSSELLISDQW